MSYAWNCGVVQVVCENVVMCQYPNQTSKCIGHPFFKVIQFQTDVFVFRRKLQQKSQKTNFEFQFLNSSYFDRNFDRKWASKFENNFNKFIDSHFESIAIIIFFDEANYSSLVIRVLISAPAFPHFCFHIQLSCSWLSTMNCFHIQFELNEISNFQIWIERNFKFELNEISNFQIIEIWNRNIKQILHFENLNIIFKNLTNCNWQNNHFHFRMCFCHIITTTTKQSTNEQTNKINEHLMMI